VISVYKREGRKDPEVEEKKGSVGEEKHVNESRNPYIT